MTRPSRKCVRPAIEGLEARVVLSLSPVAAGSGIPYSAIVKLEMTYPDGEEMVGSGSMIDAYHVLTAGHVVYSSEHGGWATSITAIPELHGTSEPYGSAQSTYVRTFTTWINYDQGHQGETSPDALDIGLITLDTAIGDQTGWLSYGYSTTNSTFSSGAIFATAGYPAANGYDGLSMQYTSGRIDGLSTGGNGILFHNPNITIYGGQSGSPVWTTSTGVVYGVAVSDSFAIRITKSVYDQLESWRTSDAPPTPVAPPPSPAPPTVLNQSFSVAAGSSVNLTPAQLLAGAVDPQGLSLSLANVSKPAHGTLVWNVRGGSYTYRPYASYSGRDTFTIQATDGSQVSNTATITINVAGAAPTPPAESTFLVTFSTGGLYQYDSTGVKYLAGGVRSANGGLAPGGDLVYTVVFANGDLYQYDTTGVHYLAGGVQSASIAYTSSGAPTYLVVFTNGALYQYDASGVTYLVGGVQSATIAYAPSGGANYEVVFANGDLFQYDATGVSFLAGGVQSASAAYTASGALVYEVIFQDGSLYQYDDAGAHYYFGGVTSANLANTYFSPPLSTAGSITGRRTSALAPVPASSTVVFDAEAVERKPPAATPNRRWGSTAAWDRRSTRVTRIAWELQTGMRPFEQRL
ncbi:MAG: Ig-like domain-containing protein [Paludisphaera borealis]|uniref:Ig-like domain-containing protein n=1 Tax=Paludisphaera borealis TaxID=1387353 RepID=UPI0028430796|nr:Ig-like domain-containing protein [Paludisphaera borealis]MDR3620862.1 Ig-like domain-containing protein [Paludisphaera borealis]